MQYIDITFADLDIDWDENPINGQVNRERIPTRKCVIDDFGDPEDEHTHHKWELLESSSIICIDQTDNQELALYGDITMLQAKTVEFQINRCDDELRSAAGKGPCKNETEIDDYIRDIEVGTWAIYNSVDFTIYGELPIQTKMDLIKFNVMDEKFALIDNLSIAKNMIYTQDDYFQLGQYTHIGEFYDVHNVLPSKVTHKIMPKTLFNTRIWLDSTMTTSNRSIYHFLDVLGDMGGVLEILIVVFGIVCCTFSEYSFIITAANKYFNARTSNEIIFDQKDFVIETERLDSSPERRQSPNRRLDDSPDREP